MATETISLEQKIKKLALNEGAVLVGICSADSIKEKEVSDPNYLLPGAKSVISIAMNFDEEHIRTYLSKKDRMAFAVNQRDAINALKALGEKIKIFLEENGFKAINCDINYDYRNSKIDKAATETLETYMDLKDKENNENVQLKEREKKTLERLNKMISAATSSRNKNNIDFTPELSHKCVAVAAGLGRIGWSGNVITEKYGALVQFNSIITDAKLEPDTPMEKNPCTNCKLCEKACQGGYFDGKLSQIINIAGIEETIGKRYSTSYCAPVCGGMIGQNRFKEWSTWSPYRLEGIEALPRDDSIDDFWQKLVSQVLMEGGPRGRHLLKMTKCQVNGLHNKPKGEFIPTCACCQLVCAPTMQDKKKNHELLKKGGCIELGKWDPEYCLK